jgi:uncharacterized protein YdiU (UPF0061 family)
MNSDNSLLCGVTMDYGPFAFMERFQEDYNPWIAGGRPYSYSRQPQAAADNLRALAKPFEMLIEMSGAEAGLTANEISDILDELEVSATGEFARTFDAAHGENCRAKLGLTSWDEEARLLFQELLELMQGRGDVDMGVDFTIFFRALTDASPPVQDTPDGRVPAAVQASALEDTSQWPVNHRRAWVEWERQYWARIARDGQTQAERQAQMARANPKYILRNWMAEEATELAKRGEYTLVRDLHELLRNPYIDRGADVDERYHRPTPTWARDRPGLAQMT